MTNTNDKITLDPVTLLRWLDQYGPLCEYLDHERGVTGKVGFGVFQITMHGKRPVKAGPVGEMKKLASKNFTVDMGALSRAIRKED